MIRSFVYWTASLSLAVMAATALGSDGSMDWTASDPMLIHALPVPEPARAAFLGIGIIAVAFTYRRAWLNMKRRSEAGS